MDKIIIFEDTELNAKLASSDDIIKAAINKALESMPASDLEILAKMFGFSKLANAINDTTLRGASTSRQILEDYIVRTKADLT